MSNKWALPSQGFYLISQIFIHSESILNDKLGESGDLVSQPLSIRLKNTWKLLCSWSFLLLSPSLLASFSFLSFSWHPTCLSFWTLWADLIFFTLSQAPVTVFWFSKPVNRIIFKFERLKFDFTTLGLSAPPHSETWRAFWGIFRFQVIDYFLYQVFL